MYSPCPKGDFWFSEGGFMTLFTLSSIRVRLLLLVFLTVFPALGLTYYNVIEHRRQAAGQAQEETLRLVRLASSNYEQLANDTYQTLDIIAQLPAVLSGDSALCKPLFIDMLKRHPFYMNIGLIKSNGDLLCSAIPANGPVNMAEQPFFLNTLQTNTTSPSVIINLKISPARPCSPLAIPSSATMARYCRCSSLNWI